jgi:hypothetical protein
MIPYGWSREALEQVFEEGEPVKLMFAIVLSDDKAMMDHEATEVWPTEYDQGKLLADVAKEKGVEILIW